jgi:hypothetical protein
VQRFTSLSRASCALSWPRLKRPSAHAQLLRVPSRSPQDRRELHRQEISGLAPNPHAGEREPIAKGKALLRHAELNAHSPDINLGRNVHAISRGVCLTTSNRNALIGGSDRLLAESAGFLPPCSRNRSGNARPGILFIFNAFLSSFCSAWLRVSLSPLSSKTRQAHHPPRCNEWCGSTAFAFPASANK